MWRALLLIAACSSKSPEIDAHTDPATCKANLEAALDRSCTTASDCVLVDSADCCGTVKLAVKNGTEDGFPAAEATYVACLACGPRGCFHPDQAEDGATPQSGQSIVALCKMQRCTSVVQ